MYEEEIQKEGKKEKRLYLGDYGLRGLKVGPHQSLKWRHG